MRCRKSMQFTLFLGMQTHATFVVKFGNADLIWNNAMQWKVVQCSWHSFRILWFWFWFNFFWKTQIDCPLEKGDNSCNLILSFANLSGNSLRVYILFDLVTWPFWIDDNGVVWRLINLFEIPGFVSPPFPFFFYLKTSTGEDFWSAPIFTWGSCTMPLSAPV